MRMIKFLILLIFSGIPVFAVCELAVIVNENNSIDEITKEQVTNIYLGRSYHLPDGKKVIPLDQAEGKMARERFYSEIVGKDQFQINSYWSRQVFSGKGRPPFSVNSNKEMMEFISTNPNMIGYVNVKSTEDSLLKNIKVVLMVK